MKVAIQVDKNSGHSLRGIGYYTDSLVKALEKCPDLEIKLFNKTEEITNVDLIHYPSFDLFKKTLPLHHKYPVVVTIHDLTPLLFPKNYPPGLRGRLNFNLQKLALRNVSHIITDSESSKKDIVRILKINPEIVNVIYLAQPDFFKIISDKATLKKIQIKYSLPEKFGLFVGSVNWNKNLLNMAEASLMAGLDLVLVGKDFEKAHDLNHPELKSYKEFLHKYVDNPKIHKLGFLSDEDLVKVTNLATVQLFPSFYEGFGLPILQAQACGVPVITSNVSSMPEVAGKGAILITPGHVGEIIQAITDIQNNSTVRQNLIKLGFINVNKFSWQKAAQQTINIYEKAVKSK